MSGRIAVIQFLDARRYGDPDAVAGIAQNELGFANGLAVDAVDEDMAFALPRHDLEAIGAEIGDKEIAVAGEGETVWQRSLGEALLFVGSLGEGGGRFLRDGFLVAAA